MDKFFKGKRVVVTGANGFIGSRLTRKLIRRGARVYALLDPDAPRQRLRVLRGGLLVREVKLWRRRFLKKIIDDIKPQIIFHLRAAISPVPGVKSRQYLFQINVDDTKELAGAALNHNLDAFVNSGTIAEYGSGPAPFREDGEARPTSVYGESKLAATKWLESYWRQYGFPAVLLRSAVVYGPGQSPHSYLIPNAIISCLKNDNFHIAASGLQTRDPLFLDDAVQGLLLAALTPQARGEIINLGLGREYSVLAITRLINKNLKNPIKIRVGSDPGRPGEAKHNWLDIGKARRLLGWRPRYSLDRGLQITAKWYKVHYRDFI